MEMMMITLEKIDEMVRSTKNPKYLLMDSKTLNVFSESFYSNVNTGMVVIESKIKAVILHSHPWPLKVLEVVTSDYLVEVVSSEV